MSLDDRLRGTYRRQLEQVQREVATRPVELERHRTQLPLTLRLVGVAAAVIILAGGAFTIAESLRSAGFDTSTVEAGNSAPDEASVPSSTPPTTLNQTSLKPTTSAPVASDPANPTSETASSSVTVTESASAGTATQAPSNPTSAVPPTSVAPTEVSPTTGATTAVPIAVGVESSVCPSGTRAELERAATRYVGENRGWGRKDDLVDEQDGPYYFMAWEPNYDLPVTVEVILIEPVLATDIRVFQDPFTPVSGTITVDVADRQVDIELSGTDGWRIHDFDEPTLVDRFSISRNGVESNIMEVLLCTE
ncbi:MAG: hypothetical protein ACRBK7_07795 [Acidimicrobiales bacterium]